MSSPPGPLAAPRPVWLCLGYFVVMLYAGTIVGPAGLHFVQLDPAEALRQFLSIRFVVNDSGQRADWIGNLLMLAPFGYLVAASVWPRGRLSAVAGVPPDAPNGAVCVAAAIGTLLICAATILAIKYLQLFFPPRTVTLNYIAAQTSGAAAGVAVFAFWHGRVVPLINPRDPAAVLVLALRLYLLALLIFLLMPLDFALNAEDFWAQAQRLPDTILASPGSGRPIVVRVVLVIIGAAAFIPAGMLLVFSRLGIYRVRRKLGAVTALGLALTSGVFLLSTLVMGAYPMVVAIPLRTCGILIGALAMRWVVAQDMAVLRQKLRALVPWLIPPYLLALLLVNRLLSMQWLGPHEAVAGAYQLGLLPLFDYYIVSKAAAAKNIAGHVLLYLPVGAGLWLRGRDPHRSKRGGEAFLLAALLSLFIETGRYFRPGLEGDINAVAVAGFSAMLAMRLMPGLWSILTALARQSASVPAGPGIDRHWDKRHGRKRRSSVTPAPGPAGEIEEY